MTPHAIPGMKHRPLTSDEWLQVRAAGSAAYRAHMDRAGDSGDPEEQAGAAADDAKEEALKSILSRQYRPTQGERP